MQLVRVFTGDDGQSHFEDITVELSSYGLMGRISEQWPGSGVLFREVDGDYDLDFHNAPRRQLVVNLTGSVELEVGDGTRRLIGPGEILLAEDTDGQGHISRNVDGEPRTCLFIPLDDADASSLVSAEPSPFPPAQLEAAAAVRRLGTALLSHHIPPELSTEVAAQLTALAEQAEAGAPRSKKEAVAGHGGQERIEHYLANGTWPPPPPDGSELTFDAYSFVGGRLSPLGAGSRYYRDGEEAIGRVSFTRAHEGPSGRAHGGIVAAVFDEVMGSVFRVRGDGSAFTGSLTVRYEAPAPLLTPVEFRSWLAATEGRKHTVEATATGPDGRFASAVATFIEMSPEHLAAAIDPDPDPIPDSAPDR